MAIEYVNRESLPIEHNFLKFEKRNKVQVCGEKLLKAMSELCTEYNKRNFDYFLNSGARGKWNDQLDEDYVTRLMENQLDLNEDRRNIFTKLPSNVHYFTRISRAGIVDECCRKPCTVETLKLYCKTY
ncbi:hypothetical protein B4U79_18285 [Dinothrombium tinctorium]|uniref:Insulin-like domain-containing protein n=1 Tax=Dinothrombium tinctorium TaxID=1965070 RepID=A0A3S3NTZ4_9ACAR|nr:hypothetical protein B4U79_18806 [Dinothrombium tinctorium]RWS02073.1 hypothetical protein B4U79_18526 [Dinothrombium tinctorium]RWS02328.1 hypothetical protein B4U79_18499 [Dinothrombium tinctorium]RWS06034.1 hypothetical protein B4U79_18285 [Dinothrombium tinctorium]